MSLATPDQQSISSEEDEEEGTGRQREFTTGSSDDEESSLSDRRFKLSSGGKRQGDSDIGEKSNCRTRNTGKIVLGMIAWRSEFSTDEDLSGVNRQSDSHWNKNSSNNTKEDWADFSAFSTTFGKPADRYFVNTFIHKDNVIHMGNVFYPVVRQSVQLHRVR